MKKTLFVISSLFLVGCATSNDMLYTQDEEQTLNLKEALPNVSNKMLALNEGEITLMDLDLNKPLIQPDGGGCSFKVGHSVDNIYTSTAAFGSNPLSFFGYTFRGYGKPRTDGFDWKGIRFQAGNRPKTILDRGQPHLVNDPFESAISIEFPFESNVTYEITLQTFIEDFIYTEQHDQYDQNDDYHGLQQSQGFPTVRVELANNPAIIGDNPCGARPVTGNGLVSANYNKKQKAEITVPPSSKQKTFVFNFSTQETKNAIIIYYLPEYGSNPFIPENSYNMFLTGIKIIKKPYDPTHYIQGGGFRN
ncbi:hypothetical protein [Chryseobacterium aureum]|uniref:hypothetical protein n=1 Tax=Chryseobacterium aureum TaxID=2497456 RepID=UPI000F89614C|nr:hypothetical protein [Chryseobacterium aureum]